MSGLVRSPTLYRLFDPDGVLLYVGCTIYPTNRLPQHREKPWFTQVATASFEHFDSPEAAAKAEQRAIDSERPKFNKRPVRFILTDAERAARAERRRADEERRRRDRVTFRAAHHYVPDLHCSNCGWNYGWIGRGKVIAETACPKCDCHSLTIEREKAAA